jgi:hypothetical protein
MNNSWTEQEKAPFSINQYALAPFFSGDGNRLYFDYYIENSQNLSIWMVERDTGKWGKPQRLPSPINLSTYSGYYSETSDGVAYINSERSGGLGSDDIWCIHPSSNQAENLGSKVNASGQDSYPCVAPDGSFLIFSSTRSGKIGYQDLYISFNKENNEWTSPINMEINGAGINLSNRHQAYPSLSPDGRFLFFTRHTASGDIEDIYWISTHTIDTLREIALPTVYQTLITWNNPDDIVYGTALSTTQLNATADVAGSFVYTPEIGTVLETGNNQLLTTTFTPSNTVNYSLAYDTVYINVTGINTTIAETIGSTISLYQDPVTLSFTITGIETEANLTMFDMTSRPVLTKTVSNNESVSMEGLPEGIYLVKIKIGNETVNKKLIKKKK